MATRQRRGPTVKIAAIELGPIAVALIRTPWEDGDDLAVKFTVTPETSPDLAVARTLSDPRMIRHLAAALEVYAAHIETTHRRETGGAGGVQGEEGF